MHISRRFTIYGLGGALRASALSGLGGALRAPLGPVAAALASSLRAPSRPHPPPDGASPGLGIPGSEVIVGAPRPAFRRQPWRREQRSEGGQHVAGGRGGKERAATLRAEQRLAWGGRRIP